jgi:hypothetical protein
MLPPIGSIALPISFERALLHHSARFRILDQLLVLISVRIGLRNNMISAAAQLAQPFAAPINVSAPEEN